MQHKILNVTESHPYEIVKVEILGNNKAEENSIRNVDEILQNYLLTSLNTMEIIQNSTPVFLIKRAKQKLGLG